MQTDVRYKLGVVHYFRRIINLMYPVQLKVAVGPYQANLQKPLGQDIPGHCRQVLHANWGSNHYFLRIMQTEYIPSNLRQSLGLTRPTYENPWVRIFSNVVQCYFVIRINEINDIKTYFLHITFSTQTSIWIFGLDFFWGSKELFGLKQPKVKIKL